MGWRDLIVTSQPARPESNNIVDSGDIGARMLPSAPHSVPLAQPHIEDIGLRYSKKSSSSLYSSPQQLISRKTSPISSKPPPPSPEALGTEAALTPPLQSGWLVAYRDAHGRLCGGADDRAHGTVERCAWSDSTWTVVLTDGPRLPLSMIRSVGRTDATGQIVAAWTVREHGYDGDGPYRPSSGAV